MSTEHGTALRLPKQLPQYLPRRAAALLVGISEQTLQKCLPPDAVYASIKGDKTFPLWTRTTVEALRAERDGGAR